MPEQRSPALRKSEIMADQPPDGVDLAVLIQTVGSQLAACLGQTAGQRLPRREISRQARDLVSDYLSGEGLCLNRLEQRGLITRLVNDFLEFSGLDEPAMAADAADAVSPASEESLASHPDVEQPDCLPPNEDQSQPEDEVVYLASLVTLADFDTMLFQTEGEAEMAPIDSAQSRVLPVLLDRIDVAAAAVMPRADLARQITGIVTEILFEERLQLNLMEQRDLVTRLINDMLGLGPLEPLLADDSVTDIMVNGARQVYVERSGKLELTNVRFRDNQHVMNIATRIVTKIGRRIDESSPLVDARLEDGSRVNIIIPPLAIDGASISIRKFSKKSITLDVMAGQSNISQDMATILKIAARSRLNILISGGTGSGKTTLLNALSQLIDHGERIVTIEDVAELQLQQPHIVRLETRPANLEGGGEITMRELVKNALRMRPDRIILGEVRGHEAVDMLQAMNTGHEGSMCTVHANNPREALTRLENMIGMAGINLPSKAVRTQITAAIDIVVQISRMRDGMRRLTSITEVTGMEDDVIITQELFNYQFEGEDSAGKLMGTFKSAGLRPHFTPKAQYFGLDKALLGAV
jgi:pilus assembly protein CpaF